MLSLAALCSSGDMLGGLEFPVWEPFGVAALPALLAPSRFSLEPFILECSSDFDSLDESGERRPSSMVDAAAGVALRAPEKRTVGNGSVVCLCVEGTWRTFAVRRSQSRKKTKKVQIEKAT